MLLRTRSADVPCKMYALLVRINMTSFEVTSIAPINVPNKNGHDELALYENRGVHRTTSAFHSKALRQGVGQPLSGVKRR